MKKRLREVWQAVIGNKHDRFQRLSKKSADPASRTDESLLEAEAAFGEAFNLQQAGRLPEAQAAYRRLLARMPKYAPAVHFLGVSYGQAGDFVEAERLIRQSIQIQETPEYFSNLALALGAQGKRDDAIAAYRNALLLAPENIAAQCKLGDLLVAQARYAEAEQAYQGALALNSDDADVYFKLGSVLSELKRSGEAIDAYRKALSLRPEYPDAYNNLGVLFKGMHRHQDAEDAFRQSLVLQPESATAQYNLGQLLQDAGRYADAQTAYLRALELRPDNSIAQNNLGSVLVAINRLGEAEEAYRAALALNPDFAEAWSNLGMVLAATARHDESEAAYKKTLTLQPDNPLALHNLANLYCKINRTSDAESAFRDTLKFDPNYAEAYSNLAVLLQNGDRHAEAEVLLRKAVALRPDSAAIHFNLGRLLFETQHYSEAEASVVSALVLQPDLADAYNVLGNLFKETGRHAEAESAYRQALASNPQLDWAHYNLGLLYLSQKRFKEGWEGFERRWHIPDFDSVRRPFSQEIWCGEVSTSEAVLVWQEQGVGDVMLCAGIMPELVARGANLVLECESRLVPLLARSFRGVDVVARSDPPHVATGRAHWQSPIGSLCRWLRPNEKDFIWRGPYLVPDSKKVAELRKRYRAFGDGPIVGISWRSLNGKIGRNKSMPLSQWIPMLALPGVTFVNLQYGDCEEDLSQLKRAGIAVHHDSTVDSLKNLDIFAAQVKAMDLVISTSNTTVHFAGALGVPVWTLLPKSGDALLWYWCDEGERCLWYPSMRLFRQHRHGDWVELMERVAVAFRGFLANFRQI